MKKNSFFFLLCLILSLTATTSAQEFVSIAELHEQAEAMGVKWQKTYETLNGTLLSS